MKEKLDRIKPKHIAFVSESGVSLGVLMRSDIEQTSSTKELDHCLANSPDSMKSFSNVKPAIARLANSETPIPVIDSEEHLIGVITRGSILVALAE